MLGRFGGTRGGGGSGTTTIPWTLLFRTTSPIPLPPIINHSPRTVILTLTVTVILAAVFPLSG